MEALSFLLEVTMKRLAIVGSRGFANLDLVEELVSRLKTTTTVVSGGARGVDTEAVRTAKARGLNTEVFEADWDKFGKSAGFRRNEAMLSTVDGDAAFWDGTSRGTKHAIEYARKKDLWLRVYQK